MVEQNDVPMSQPTEAAIPEQAQNSPEAVVPAPAPSALLQYISHKTVTAAKIIAIESGLGNASYLRFGPAEGKFVEKQWMERHYPEVGGYFVIYEDGYTSYSPAHAFENGYSEIDTEHLVNREVIPFAIHELPPVFPSNIPSVFVEVPENDQYGGAHNYRCVRSLGFENGEALYEEGMKADIIRFVHKPQDGSPTISGLQSEQLLLILLDRHKKLNAVYPSEQHDMFVQGIEQALLALRLRVEERMNRGVMGQLKK